MNNEEILLDEELLLKLREDKTIQILVDTYLMNCGICISYRTVSLDIFCGYMTRKYQVTDYKTIIDYFNYLLDEIDVEHRKYDISGNIDLSTYDRIEKEILESIKQKTN